jgi:hypothetical protein
LESEPKESQSKSGAGSRKKRGFSGALLRFMAFGFAIVLVVALPFVVLVRTSVFFLQQYPVSGWGALLGGALATVLLLFLYLAVLSLRLGGKGRVPKTIRRGTGILVGAYCVYALVYLSGANAKTEEIRATYSSLNPVIRVAVSTLLLVDREGVLTDTRRTPEDYERWGLPVNEASLHLPQADGYVHAVDIRTIGRPEWQNRAAALYFALMGFETIRHVGTADHLHVGLAPPLALAR